MDLLKCSFDDIVVHRGDESSDDQVEKVPVNIRVVFFFGFFLSSSVRNLQFSADSLQH